MKRNNQMEVPRGTSVYNIFHTEEEKTQQEQSLQRKHKKSSRTEHRILFANRFLEKSVDSRLAVVAVVVAVAIFQPRQLPPPHITYDKTNATNVMYFSVSFFLLLKIDKKKIMLLIVNEFTTLALKQIKQNYFSISYQSD